MLALPRLNLFQTCCPLKIRDASLKQILLGLGAPVAFPGACIVVEGVKNCKDKIPASIDTS